MSETKDLSSSRQTAIQTRSVANNVSAGAKSFPAVPLYTSETNDVTEENVTHQLKSGANSEGDGSVDNSNGGSSQQNNPNPAATKPIQKKGNQTGLPDQLKSGIENMSGYDMSDVNVHYNSAQPAQLNALAYAQGTNIHVAPGQEKHLPHEAWHVVQQKQGRVKPTIQMKQGVGVNDDAGLEQEADIMGMKALNFADNHNAIQAKHSSLDNFPTNPVQLTKVKIIGVTFGKTRIYNGNGAAVGHIAKGSEIDIDEGSTYVAGSRTLVKITSGDASILWNNPDALLNDSEDLWISQTRFTKPEEGAEDAEPANVSIPLFGQELKIGKDSAELSGSIEKSIDFSTPKVNLSFDFPLPSPVPAYVTVGLDVGVNFNLGVAGDYAIEASGSGQKVTVNSTANGSAKMNVDVHVGAGVGVANLGGIEGGLFAGAASEFNVEGSIKGEITKDAMKAWAASTLEIKLKSNASLVGNAGAYIKAKLLQFSKEKKFTLLRKEFAKWEYERTRSIQKAGVTISDIIPTLADFKLLLDGQDASEFSVAEDMSDTAPLLGRGSRESSDS
ncbi:MAG: DUF4157 domain-containing protein [Daejeonella sp.]|uniref:eCIS core domain-containing protein n=1 Tax=Daejeonella sp. TaxID=2805397 RepID=UPI002737179E|nr:DUF4157 domain-containing protein [Daejeonella sp.]MDP3468474.1 DUF4157 domain-containing protein [Daejeonella sp.]